MKKSLKILIIIIVSLLIILLLLIIGYKSLGCGNVERRCIMQDCEFDNPEDNELCRELNEKCAGGRTDCSFKRLFHIIFDRD